MTSRYARPLPRLARYAADTRPYERTWWRHGACTTTTDPDAWHPEGESVLDERNEAAQHVCRTCPVIDQCRDYALARPWITGIWGATTTEDRHTIRRAARRNPAA